MFGYIMHSRTSESEECSANLELCELEINVVFRNCQTKKMCKKTKWTVSKILGVLWYNTNALIVRERTKAVSIMLELIASQVNQYESVIKD